ncbi:hypothetical protein LR48_Vigan09g184400 [Vigna angularis]|uniref:Transposase (putative) gypsy type domain-containing protein n=1 Tax=Phaseolus angularis TaxID=3914 RepID=A0A0L9VDQ0_PHAAN|nr:hypothetical protein LR48_Vigan09g184400 [Vigna angularis]
MSSDFSGDEGRGYADNDNASPSSSSLALFSGPSARASPSGNSSDLLVDSDAPDEVAIHVDSTGAWDGKPRAWPPVPGYEWVPHEVRQLPSSFYDRQAFRNLIPHVCLVKSADDARHFKLAICQRTERVCHGRGNYPSDFFYVYATMFKDLKVLLPFSDFQMGVLRTLNLAPTQLHPNGWAFMQVFSAICSGLALYLTPAAFLYFFHVQPHPSKPWVSFRTVGNKHLLTLFNSSYKDFKNHFFKVVPTEIGQQSFCFPTGEAKFPFYWTRDPRKVLSWPKPQMAPEDLDLINQLCQLPPKSFCRALIGFLGKTNLPSNVFGKLSLIVFRRAAICNLSEFSSALQIISRRWIRPRTTPSPACSLRGEAMCESRAGVHPKPPPLLLNLSLLVQCHRFPFLRLRSRLWPIQRLLPSPPPKKKGKRKAARETFAESKHAKRSLPDGPPLPSLLSPNSWVAKHLHFDHFAEDKALISGMTEEEVSNMSLELTARAALCQTYAAYKRASASAELQELQAKLESTIKANQDLTLRLAETERMAEEDKNKASTLLAEGRAVQRRMQRSLDDAKLDLQKATASNTTLTTERDSLLDRVTKLEAEVKLLGDEVVNEHVLGFDKAVAQCHLLFQVPTDDPRLDVSMMVVDDKLVPIHVPPSSPPVGQNVEAPIETVGETDGAEGQP